MHLIKNLCISTELLQILVFSEIGHKIHAIKFDDCLCTDQFILSLENRIFAILSALIKYFLLKYNI